MFSKFFFQSSYYQVTYQKKQPPSFLNHGDSYEEELKIGIFLNISFIYVKVKLHAEIQVLMCQIFYHNLNRLVHIFSVSEVWASILLI